MTGIEKTKAKKCLVCQWKDVDAAHIKTKGSGGSDDEWNLMPLCRKHHSEQHALGIITFSKKYFFVAMYLEENGWFLHHGKLLNERFAANEYDNLVE